MCVCGGGGGSSTAGNNFIIKSTRAVSSTLCAKTSSEPFSSVSESLPGTRLSVDSTVAYGSKRNLSNKSNFLMLKVQ